ncbi:hypothetical protein P20439_1598 [Pseudoalteromonas sp. BSi20439]|nr:hypothetical protein P20439_1598 [Pseudoalteromonas sp. BSi20439]
MLLVVFFGFKPQKSVLYGVFFIVWDLVVEGDNKLNPTQW